MLSRVKSAIGGLLDRYCPKAWLSYRIWRGDRHFEAEFWLIPLLCDRQHIAIDIGANMGEYAFYMARYAERVMAFEPNLDLLMTLRSRLPNNVELHDVALSRAAGVATFRVILDNTGISTIEPRNDLVQVAPVSTIQTRQVPVRTLDSFQFENVSMIKIDVEGHEEAVLDGAVETLRQNRPAIILESEDRHNPGAPHRIARWLRELGYQKFYLSKGQLVPSPNGSIQGNSGSSYNHIFLLPERVEGINSVMMSGLPQRL